MEKEKLDTFFLRASRYVKREYRPTLNWCRKLSLKTFRGMKPDVFLEWYAWVVYTTGFKVVIIEKKFPSLKKAFKGFRVEHVRKMRNLGTVLATFKNKRKARSVVEGARMISGKWFTDLKQHEPKEALDKLDELPYIGPVTKNHLARDIGLGDVAKPDRWILRLTKLSRFSDYRRMVKYLSSKFGEKYGVVDLILWAYCADHFKGEASLAHYWQSL